MPGAVNATCNAVDGGGFISTAFGDAMAFAVLMAILAVRPQGLFGRRDIVKV